MASCEFDTAILPSEVSSTTAEGDECPASPRSGSTTVRTYSSESTTASQTSRKTTTSIGSTESGGIWPKDSRQSAFEMHFGGFTAVERLGVGSFGEVWRGINPVTKDEAAMKFEPMKSQPSLLGEVQTLKALSNCENQHPQGFACYFSSGHEGPFNCMVMEILGKSLKERTTSCGRKLTVQTTALIAEQVLQRIEFLHSKCMIHRDIKPENFMFGINDKVHHVYLIDFGLSKAYWTRGSDGKEQHIPEKRGYGAGGTARYLSINAHGGVEQSRRDDLEAIGYMFLHLIKGSLPWSCFDTKNANYPAQVGRKKWATPLSELCQGVPPELEGYMTYCRNLGFKGRPDYNKLFGLLHSCREPGSCDHDYEWFDGKAGGEVAPAKLEPLQPRTTLSQPDDYVPRTRSSGLFRFFRRGTTRRSSSKVVPSG